MTIVSAEYHEFIAKSSTCIIVLAEVSDKLNFGRIEEITKLIQDSMLLLVEKRGEKIPANNFTSLKYDRPIYSISEYVLVSNKSQVIKYVEKCHLGRNVILDEMSSWTKCHLGRNVILDEMSYWTKCHLGRNVILDEMSSWTICHLGQNVILKEMSS